MGDVDSLLSSHEAQNGEDHKTSKEAGAAVDESQNEGVPAEEKDSQSSGDHSISICITLTPTDCLSVTEVTELTSAAPGLCAVVYTVTMDTHFMHVLYD